MIDIDKIVADAVPIPRSCQLNIQRAYWRREKLKKAIVQLLQENTNFTQTVKNELVDRPEEYSTSPITETE